MSKVHTFSRLANVPEEVAMAGLKKSLPKNAQIVSFAKKGKEYVVQVKTGMGEEDLIVDDVDDVVDEPMDTEMGVGDEIDEMMDEDMDEDKDQKILDILEQIADKLGISDGMEDEMDELGEEGMPVDMGEEPPMEPMSEEPPPPVSLPKSQMGQAFGSLRNKVTGFRTFTLERKQASELNNKNIIAEAHTGFPDYRVIKVDRLTKAASDTAIVMMQKKAN